MTFRSSAILLVFGARTSDVVLLKRLESKSFSSRWHFNPPNPWTVTGNRGGNAVCNAIKRRKERRINLDGINLGLRRHTWLSEDNANPFKRTKGKDGWARADEKVSNGFSMQTLIILIENK